MLRQKIQVQKSVKPYCHCEMPGTAYIWIGVIQKKFCHAISLEFPEARKHVKTNVVLKGLNWFWLHQN